MFLRGFKEGNAVSGLSPRKTGSKGNLPTWDQPNAQFNGVLLPVVRSSECRETSAKSGGMQVLEER